MNTDLDFTTHLQTQVEHLEDKNWQVALKAENILADSGQPGLDAVLAGLSHENVRVRRGCARFMDHHSDDSCLPQLQWTALHDPAPSVRREAVHSASCQRCKACPLTGDLVAFLIQVLQTETNTRVREQAIYGFQSQPQDPRAIAILEQILQSETNPRLLRDAHTVLKYQDPKYRAFADAQARARTRRSSKSGIEA